jgi:hypothetical protein
LLLPLFVLLSLVLWPLFCLTIDLRFLITPLVSTCFCCPDKDLFVFYLWMTTALSSSTFPLRNKGNLQGATMFFYSM